MLLTRKIADRSIVRRARVLREPLTLRVRLLQNIAGYGAEARLAGHVAGAGRGASEHLAASVSVPLETIDAVLAPHRARLERDAVRFERTPSIGAMVSTLVAIVREAYPRGEVVPVTLEHIIAPPMGWVRVGDRSTLPLPAVGAVVALHENDGRGGPGAPIGLTWTAGDGGIVQISALLALRP